MWGPSEWIALGAAVISVIALAISGLSVRYTHRQTVAMESSEQRARDAERPVVGADWDSATASEQGGALTSRNQFRELVDLDQRLADEPWLAEFSTSSRDAGRSHLERLRPLRDQRLVRRYGDAVTADEAHGWHVLVVGMALSLYSIPLRQGLMDYALHTLCSTVGQATRSMPLTQPETHEVLDAVTADLSAKVQSLVQPLPLIGV